MTVTVSVSDLRNNISLYLERVMKGARVIIRDEKKDIAIAQITQTFSFDKKMYEKALQKAAGIFSSDNHPEWSTKSKIIDWVTRNRLSDERHF